METWRVEEGAEGVAVDVEVGMMGKGLMWRWSNVVGVEAEVKREKVGEVRVEGEGWRREI